jgi:hypothetical protein
MKIVLIIRLFYVHSAGYVARQRLVQHALLIFIIPSHGVTTLITSSFCFAVSTFVPKKGIVSSGPTGVQGAKNSGSMRSSTRNDIKMMPIGVPKVAYRVPGGQGAEW